MKTYVSRMNRKRQGRGHGRWSEAGDQRDGEVREDNPGQSRVIVPGTICRAADRLDDGRQKTNPVGTQRAEIRQLVRSSGNRKTGQAIRIR